MGTVAPDGDDRMRRGTETVPPSHNIVIRGLRGLPTINKVKVENTTKMSIKRDEQYTKLLFLGKRLWAAKDCSPPFPPSTKIRETL